jgi:hypothetical protein
MTLAAVIEFHGARMSDGAEVGRKVSLEEILDCVPGGVGAARDPMHDESVGHGIE